MRNLYAIYRKEMSHYFVSPIAYIIIGLFLLITGFFFTNLVNLIIQQSFEMTMQSARFGTPFQMDVPSAVLRNFFAILGSLLLFLLPMLTMGVYSEERKRGTMELLMTSPITDAQIVLGKFLASLSLFSLMILPTACYQVFLFLYSDPRPPWRLILVGYLGVMLLGAVLLAIGSFISSLTENQLIAAVLTFGTFLLLWVIDIGGRGAETVSGQVLQYLSVIRHYDDFTRGVIDTSSLIFYASWIVLGIFLTMRAVDSMRWRRA
ncbi:MAG TPA: ABC transporter permease [Candidatus Acidoferrales bacterium]|jgi:ABC-2 type transport system permease protein|nr:ABC transporter permease [Candidatus Acidoferrales bacterium]